MQAAEMSHGRSSAEPPPKALKMRLVWLGRPATSFEQFVNDHREAFVAGPHGSGCRS